MSGPDVTAVYKVKDAFGRLVAEHVRKDGPEGKRVSWRRPDGTWGLGGIRLEDLPLYGSELLADWPEDRPVALVEGEKAADELNRTGIILALGTVTGASGTPSAEVLEVLRGRDVILWPDGDEPGHNHMRRVAERLRGLAGSVCRYDWPDAPDDVKGPDAADHPAVIGGGEKALGILLDDLLGAPPYDPKEESKRGLQGRVMIGERIAGGVEPPEQLVEGVLYRGRLHAINAEPGDGKTITALWAVREIVRQGLPVLYLDAENGPGLIAERLREMGVEAAKLDELLHYFPSPDVSTSASALEDLRVTAQEIGAALVVFDSLPDFLALADLDENSAGDVTRWILNVAQPLKDQGAAILMLDHVTKSTEGRGRYARGSGAKLAKCDVVWSLTQTLPFDRDRVGELRLTLRKDREAFLPRRTTFAVGGTPDGLMFERADGVEETPEASDGLTESQRHALEALRGLRRDDGEGATYSEWKTAAGMADTTFDRARDALLKCGLVMRISQRYHATNPEPPLYPHDDFGKAVPAPTRTGGGNVSRIDKANSPTPTNPQTTPAGVNGGGAKPRTPTNPHPPYRGGGRGGGAGGTPPQLGIEEVAEEIRRHGSGPQKALVHCLAGPNPERLGQLTRAVMHQKGMSTEGWEMLTAVVWAAASDPENHPIGCECEGCL